MATLRATATPLIELTGGMLSRRALFGRRVLHPPRSRVLTSVVLVSMAGTFQPNVTTQSWLEQLLQTVGNYLNEYEKPFSLVLCAEHYVQRGRSNGKLETRDLRSEVALIAVDDGSWVFFRDVYQVDGNAVGDRSDRLAALFVKPTFDSGVRAKQILDEGARYNVGPVTRTLNTPTQALDFIRVQNQSRSVFRLVGCRVADGAETCELRFQETAKPRMIVTRDSAAAAGRFWVLPETGTIVRTELRIRSAGVLAVLTTTYAKQKELSLWVPTHMTEFYELQGSEATSVLDVELTGRSRENTTLIEGDATYTDFRQFSVNTKILIR